MILTTSPLISPFHWHWVVGGPMHIPTGWTWQRQWLDKARGRTDDHEHGTERRIPSACRDGLQTGTEYWPDFYCFPIWFLWCGTECAFVRLTPLESWFYESWYSNNIDGLFNLPRHVRWDSSFFSTTTTPISWHAKPCRDTVFPLLIPR